MDELEQRLGQAKSSLSRELQGVQIPELVDGAPSTGAHARTSRSYVPFASAAALVGLLTAGAFVVAQRPADDRVVTEPAATRPPSVADAAPPFTRSTAPSTTLVVAPAPTLETAPPAADETPSPTFDTAPPATGDADSSSTVDTAPSAPAPPAATETTTPTTVASAPPATVATTVPTTSPTTSPTTVSELPPINPTGPLVSDRDPRPVTPVGTVAKGSTFIEPDFGTTITRLTATESGSVIAPASSTSQVFNADSSLLLLYRTGVDDAGHLVVDARSGDIVATLDLSRATDIEDIAWDATDPNLLRYVDAERAELVEIQLDGETVTTPIPGGCDRADFGGVAGASAGRSSLMAIVCRSGDDADWIAYDTSTNSVVARRSALPLANGDIDAPMTMASGDGFVSIDEESIVVFDAALEPTGVTVDIEVSAATLALDPQGRDVLVAVVFDGDAIGTTVEVDLTSGVRRVITGETTGYPYPPIGTTIGVVGGVNSSLVVLATSPGDDETDLLDNEVLLVDIATDTTFRLAHHRMTDAAQFGNWARPFVAVSPDGSSVVFSSNFGGNAVDTYLVSLPA